MNKIQRKQLYKKAWEKWGMTAQLMVFMEECAELTQAISKYSRYSKTSAQPSRDIVEEIADVEIMIEQMETRLDWENFRKRIETAKHDKLLKLDKVINGRLN